MSKTENLQKLGMFLLLWLVVISGKEAWAQGRGPPPEQIFDYMDKNKNGRMDPDEIENSRGPFKEMLQKAGVDYRKGIDKKSFGKAFEKIRQQREAEGSDRSREDEDRKRREEYEKRKREYYEKQKREAETRSKKEGSKTPSKKSAPVIKPKPRVTVDMPTTFTEGDRDTDGQIGFYEWKKWKRDAISDFLKYDHNNDGFLTPRELAAGPNEALAVVTPTKPAPTAGAAKPAVVAKTGTPAAKPAPIQTSVDLNSVAARRAESMFRLLDKDRDDLLSGDEWNRSRTIKPLFEKGGIDLAKPMSKNDFLTNYVRLSDS